MMIHTDQLSEAWQTVVTPKKARPQLPEVGRRCRLRFKECEAVTERGSMKIREGYELYGYLAYQHAVYIPLYKVVLPVANLEMWMYDEINPCNGKKFPLYFNGFGRDQYEAFRVMHERNIH